VKRVEYFKLLSATRYLRKLTEKKKKKKKKKRRRNHVREIT